MKSTYLMGVLLLLTPLAALRADPSHANANASTNAGMHLSSSAIKEHLEASVGKKMNGLMRAIKEHADDRFLCMKVGELRSNMKRANRMLNAVDLPTDTKSTISNELASMSKDEKGLKDFCPREASHDEAAKSKGLETLVRCLDGINASYQKIEAALK